jgi:drug/metabolite transporter (DMT)-like permease
VSFSRLDLLLLLMTLIWGANFSVLKVALEGFPELPFNVVRLTIASGVFLWAIAAGPDRASVRQLTRRDWVRIVALGLVGHLLYQLCFLAGVARTSVANSSLIFGCTPVAVGILASLAGHERPSMARWAGVALSCAGIYAIVGEGAGLSTATLRGDALVFAGMCCWSLYSVLGQPLLRRFSALLVTGLSMTAGTTLYALVAVGPMLDVRWSAIAPSTWVLTVGSALLALAFAYIVWYTAVQQIGSSRTAIYSNLTPIVAMVVAAVWLGEPIGIAQVVGASLILGGIFVARGAGENG